MRKLLGSIVLVFVLPMTGQAAERVYPMAAFSALTLQGGMQLEVTSGTRQSVSVVEPDGKFDGVKVSALGGRLIVRTEPNVWRLWQRAPRYTVKVMLVSLDDVQLSGAVQGRLTRLLAKNIKINASGASQLHMDGVCAEMHLVSSGALQLDAAGFKCNGVDITVSGSATAAVFARQHVQATASGVAHIDIYGKPADVQQHASGVASIRFVGR